MIRVPGAVPGGMPDVGLSSSMGSSFMRTESPRVVTAASPLRYACAGAPTRGGGLLDQPFEHPALCEIGEPVGPGQP